MYAGKKLRQLREQLELSQGEIAAKIGVSQSYYSAIEIGKRELTPRLKLKIIVNYDLPRDYFEGENTKNNTKSNTNLGGEVEGSVEGKESAFNMTEFIDTILEQYNATKPTRYSKKLNPQQIEFEYDLAIDTLKDLFTDRKRLNNSIYKMGAPDFMHEKFPMVDESFADYLKELESEYFEDVENYESLKEANKLKLVNNVYHPAIEHQRTLLSKLIMYIDQYGDMFTGGDFYNRKAVMA